MEYLWMVFVGIAVLIFVLGLCGVIDLNGNGTGTSVNKHLHCSHCGSTGTVTRRAVTQKKGISGGKATGAILTGGISLLATGLSRKEKATQMSCNKCGTTWFV